MAEIAGEFRPDHISARGQKLPELDVARPEPAHGVRDTLFPFLSQPERPRDCANRPGCNKGGANRERNLHPLRNEAHAMLRENETRAGKSEQAGDRGSHRKPGTLMGSD